MPRIQWSTLICDTDKGVSTGRISLHRVRKLSTIVAFWGGVAVALVATLVEVLTGEGVPTSMVLILVGALIAPIMGGQVSDAIFGKNQSAKIQEGRAPGRRSSDG